VGFAHVCERMHFSFESARKNFEHRRGCKTTSIHPSMQGFEHLFVGEVSLYTHLSYELPSPLSLESSAELKMISKMPGLKCS
jgi:hypothetical protein